MASGVVDRPILRGPSFEEAGQRSTHTDPDCPTTAYAVRWSVNEPDSLQAVYDERSSSPLFDERRPGRTHIPCAWARPRDAAVVACQPQYYMWQHYTGSSTWTATIGGACMFS